MQSSHFNLNMPVHLARRDVYYRKAVELMHVPMSDLETTARIAHMEKILPLLATAEKHSRFAARSTHATEKSRDFLHFLKLIADNVESIHAMMLHQAHLEAAESFLCQFLHTTPDQCTLPAMHYRRRADDLLDGACHLLRLAHIPYQSLLKDNQASMSDEEKERYRKAYVLYQTELNGTSSAARSRH